MPNSDDAVELFLKIASVRHTMDTAWENTAEAKECLKKGDFACAIERFGVAHEDLREISQLAKSFATIDQTAKILESTQYGRLLDFLGEVELALIDQCERPCPSAHGTYPMPIAS